MNSARTDAYVERSKVFTQRQVQLPRDENGRPLQLSEFFGKDVFSLSTLQKTLPKPVFQNFVHLLRDSCPLDKPTADAIAHAVRVWAQERGATHFTHWFQPQTGSTAEKHDSFLNLQPSPSPVGMELKALDTLSGSQLIQAEPDASSFPSGGVRTTFEARGYTIWDVTSPMFLRRNASDAFTLYIPSVFISYHGEALDEKTVLLRSCEVLSKTATKLLHLLGKKDVTKVWTSLGTEQEFFLVDRALYSMRPDLKCCGRTLFGSLPSKHQQLEDHYFGRIPTRVAGTIAEAEFELIRLGVPIKTRHNEVAPCQFEMAPTFEEAVIAVDHNLLTMDVLHKVAHRHGLKVLFHEKPFSGINGSGKHCNWSMSTDKGENLLNPTDKPEENYQFLLILVATLQAVHTYAGLLRAAISSASNEYRLGAQEAPPGIISVFLGDQLNEVLNSVEANRPVARNPKNDKKQIKFGGAGLDVSVSTLPDISRDLTDRNRTSPFAFTGNKFEFRAVGSKQSPAFPMTILNAAVASTLLEVIAALEKAKGSKEVPSKEDILSVIRTYIQSSKNVRFEGDNYSDAWVKEAEKRGLLNIATCPEAFKQLLMEKNIKALTEKVNVFTESELKSRYHVLQERYAKDVLIEAHTLRGMIMTLVIPAAYEYRKMLAETAHAVKSIGGNQPLPEAEDIADIGNHISKLKSLIQELDKAVEVVDACHDEVEEAEKCCALVKPIMKNIAQEANTLECKVSDKLWPVPKLSEMLL